MTVSVNIETAKRDRALAIPNDALTNVQGNQASVLLVRNGKIQHQPITLGLRGLAISEVIAGLKAGDHILANPVSSLTDGTRVRLKLEKIPFAQEYTADSKNELPVKFN
jgi:HlyD family secretion protein